MNEADTRAEKAGRAAAGGGFRAGAHRRTDAGNADRFAEMHCGRLLWVHGMGWLTWDGRRWLRDETNEVQRRAVETARAIYLEAAALNADAAGAEDPKAAADEAEATTKWAVHSESRQRLDAMVHIGKSRPGLVLEGGARALDPEPDALNVANGVLDLRTFELSPHDPARLCTRVAGAEFRDDLTDDDRAEWLSFLARVVPSPEVREFVQKQMGAALRGQYSEELLIPWGSGKNGKSTFLRAVRRALGDYAMEAAPELLIQSRGKRNAGEEAAVAELQGRRFVTTIETAEGARLHETFVKQLTGESVLKAKFMRENPFEFENQATLALATNHKPLIQGNDVAIWERLRLVPFDVHIPAAERDPHLGRRLENKTNAAVVLAWMVEGLAKLEAFGMGDPPEEVAGATAAYRDEMDPLSDWLDAAVVADPEGKAPIPWVYASYSEHCAQTGAAPMPQREFNAALETRGSFQRDDKAQRVHGKVRKVWRGLSLRDEWQLAYLESQNVHRTAPTDDEINAWIAEEQNTERAARLRDATERGGEPKGLAR
ncbi:MAG TPA: phage/plasmid primase, P4 family [Thermomicrobiales bacterium]|nr:phage/plasmid primase, P4 family [Thermomicrobiales bacterium]